MTCYDCWRFKDQNLHNFCTTLQVWVVKIVEGLKVNLVLQNYTELL